MAGTRSGMFVASDFYEFKRFASALYLDAATTDRSLYAHPFKDG